MPPKRNAKNLPAKVDIQNLTVEELQKKQKKTTKRRVPTVKLPTKRQLIRKKDGTYIDLTPTDIREMDSRAMLEKNLYMLEKNLNFVPFSEVQEMEKEFEHTNDSKVLQHTPARALSRALFQDDDGNEIPEGESKETATKSTAKRKRKLSAPQKDKLNQMSKEEIQEAIQLFNNQNMQSDDLVLNPLTNRKISVNSQTFGSIKKKLEKRMNELSV